VLEAVFRLTSTKRRRTTSMRSWNRRSEASLAEVPLVTASGGAVSRLEGCSSSFMVTQDTPDRDARLDVGWTRGAHTVGRLCSLEQRAAEQLCTMCCSWLTRASVPTRRVADGGRRHLSDREELPHQRRDDQKISQQAARRVRRFRLPCPCRAVLAGSFRS